MIQSCSSTKGSVGQALEPVPSTVLRTSTHANYAFGKGVLKFGVYGLSGP